MIGRSKSAAIAGSIALITTFIVVLLLGKEWNTVSTISYIFILFSEFVFFGSFILADRLAKNSKQPITRSIFGVMLSIYALLVFVISLYFFLKSPEDGLKYFIIIQIFLIAIVAIILVITYNTSKTVNEKDTKTMAQVNSLLDSCNRLKALAQTVDDKDLSKTIKNLAEDLYFTNLSEASTADAAIEDLVSALEIEAEKDSPDKYDKMNDLCIKLKSQIAKRKATTGARRGTI